jgi:hypothetical protein
MILMAIFAYFGLLECTTSEFAKGLSGGSAFHRYIVSITQFMMFLQL